MASEALSTATAVADDVPDGYGSRSRGVVGHARSRCGLRITPSRDEAAGRLSGRPDLAADQSRSFRAGWPHGDPLGTGRVGLRTGGFGLASIHSAQLGGGFHELISRGSESDSYGGAGANLRAGARLASTSSTQTCPTVTRRGRKPSLARRGSDLTSVRPRGDRMVSRDRGGSDPNHLLGCRLGHRLITTRRPPRQTPGGLP